MDSARAERLSKELINSDIDGWHITGVLGNGKSAIVFEGEKDGTQAAVKVFDPELIERFGEDTQIERINRELALIDHDNDNLIQIIGGGVCNTTHHLYIAMEKINWPSLDQVLNEIPRDSIWDIIKGVSLAAKFLEEKNIVHRDIKPSNIIIDLDNFKNVKLLDLGVIRPIGNGDLTDDDSKPFVGTLRYSSPEFLLREEKDNITGWKAVTYYQLGGVLHDMIMKVPLFDGSSVPYAKLVHTVSEEIPQIEASDVDPELILLARNSLTKDPDVRLSLVTSWDSFIKPIKNTSEATLVRQRLRQRKKLAQATINPNFSLEDERQNRKNMQGANEILDEFERISHKIAVASDVIPPAKFINSPDFQNYRGEYTAEFLENPDFALNVDFSIIFNVIITDVNQKILKIMAVAFIAPYSNVRETDFIEIYNGVIQKAIIEERLDLFYCSSIDKAQEINDKTIKNNGILLVSSGD